MFEGMAKSEDLKGYPGLPANNLTSRNTLAHFVATSMSNKKSFITLSAIAIAREL